MGALLSTIVEDPSVAERLALTDPVAAISPICRPTLQTDDLSLGPLSFVKATTTTLTTTGVALMGSALTTAVGFGVLLFGSLIPFQQFGMVTAITILYSLPAALVVVSPLLVIGAAYQQWHRKHVLEGHGWTTADA